MVQCQRGVYVGSAINVPQRVKKHNEGRGSKAVKSLGLPAELVYQEIVGDKEEALQREREIKLLPSHQRQEMVRGYLGL